MYAYTCIHTYICIYIYKHIYTYTHTHTHTHTHTPHHTHTHTHKTHAHTYLVGADLCIGVPTSWTGKSEVCMSEMSAVSCHQFNMSEVSAA